MTFEFLVLVMVMAVCTGYALFWSIQKLRKVWQIYVAGRKLKERWDDEIVELMAGDTDE